MMTPEIYNRLMTDKKVGYEVTFFQVLSEIGEYKYKDKCIKYRISDSINFILKEYYEPLGLWLRNPHPQSKLTDFGVVLLNRWHRLNTLNTNLSGQLYLFSQCNVILESLKKSGKDYIEIDGKIIYTEKIRIGENWREDIESTYEKIHSLLLIVRKYSNLLLDYNSPQCKEMMSICANVMMIGDIGEMLFKRFINEFFPNYLRMKCSSGLGDPLDRETGVDFWVVNSNNFEEKIQVKYANYYINNENQILTKSKFSTRSNCHYWVMVYKDSIIMLKNDLNKNKQLQDTTWVFPEEVVVKKIKIIDMFEELKNLMKIASKNNINVVMTKDGDINKIIYDEETKTVTIQFPDAEDKGIKKMVIDETERLNKLFN